MSFLTPIGFLGLMGIVALIIIYIIKPNYQTKYVSSTYIWKLSLKYKRNKIPINTLRNVLLFICQVLIITAATLILTRPMMGAEKQDETSDAVYIIDASASMLTETKGESRFERAANIALAEAEEALEEGRRVSVIIASDTSSFMLKELTPGNEFVLKEAFSKLTASPEEYYTYAEPDIEGAVKLAEQITSIKENVALTLYTDTTYLNSGKIKVHDVKDVSEWNAAILDVRAEIVENYYRIEIDVASYGADSRLSVMCEIAHANGNNDSLVIEHDAYCTGDETTTLVFARVIDSMPDEAKDKIDKNVSLFSYDSINVSVSANDSFAMDNTFWLYGGMKPVLNVQYYSSMPNSYFTTAMLVIQDSLKDRYSLNFDEVLTGEPAIKGYDLYIFEHSVPTTLPTDGVVLCVNPNVMSSSSGIRFGSMVNSGGEEMFLAAGEDHPIMKNIDPSSISVSAFNTVTDYDGYTPLATCMDYPMILVKEEADQHIVLLPFSLHYSNLALTPAFTLMLNNTLDYFFPSVVEEHVFEVNDTVSLNARGGYLEFIGPNTDIATDELPAEIKLIHPGSYIAIQYTMSGERMDEDIYVSLCDNESNINLVVPVLDNPYYYSAEDASVVDLLFYVALAAVALLFIEWWLKSREQI